MFPHLPPLMRIEVGSLVLGTRDEKQPIAFHPRFPIPLAHAVASQ